MKNLIQQKAAEYKAEIIAMRRHLHQHPELSFDEIETSKFVCKQLTEYGINYKKDIVKTGIVALIEGKNPTKKIIALRADLDALPIIEENEVSYKSLNNGVMHACGHDVHTASLLGVAKILNELKDKWEGSVKLIFQPGEEKLPGGASLMIEEGVLENPSPVSIIGQHVYPQLEAGKVGFRKGMYMASTDELYLTIKGKGGHAALPSEYNNPLLIASTLLLELDKAFMKQVPCYSLIESDNERIPTVLAFGKIIGNGATNVIPNEVKIEGTFRTMNEAWRTEAHYKMKNIAEEIVTNLGGSCVFEIRKGYPFLVNDEEVTQNAIDAAIQFLGKENVIDLDVRMTAEDFAYYSQVIPACFYRLGIAKKNVKASGLHTPTFDIDENAIETSIGLMSWLAINELKK
ncbi:MAG: N-acyl-L-amino acid amidohydrolase [Flavobacteriales bacterium CG18_big_fil_WC_8_21_14_2_50_32_9]|nr:amidohydrolase [Flavobacteriales bacterium]PIQ16149.1 MAG: N-acyl-L-amino acid amidohydrolase [Flavobacteriales bacterium CG18_big_fil_WC_8_21_14_2_50_32_9]PJC62321.1 MAG: amidohydrolase [Flavobacteriales bacterium CG_4_9_14_0_2_um_filter_32_27]